MRSFKHALGILVVAMLCTSNVMAQGGRTGRSGSRTQTPPPVVEENPYAVAEDDSPYTGTTPPPVVTTPPPVVTTPPPVDDVANPPAATDAEPTASAVAAANEDRHERVKFHALGLGWHATMFTTELLNGYTLQGPEMAYTYFVGRKWGFSLRGALYFPTYGYMAGPNGSLRINLRDSYEQTRVGLDGVVGVARRVEIGDSLVLLVGMGLHTQSFRLNGAQYYPVEGITAGIGAYARLDWRISSLFSLGVDVMGAIDVLDFIGHENRITYLSPLAGAITLGVTY